MEAVTAGMSFAGCLLLLYWLRFEEIVWKTVKCNALKTRWLRRGKKITRSHVASKKPALPGTSKHIAHLRPGHCFCCFDHQVGSVGSKLYFGALDRSETTLCNPLGSTNGIMSYLPFSQFAALVQAHRHEKHVYFFCFSHWQGNRVHTSRVSEFFQNACQSSCPLTQHARHVCVREEAIVSASLSDCMTHQGQLPESNYCKVKFGLLKKNDTWYLVK